MNTKCLLRSAAPFIGASLIALSASPTHAVPRPCRQGLKGIYVTWDKNSSSSGTGEFDAASGRAAVLPGFTWSVTGNPTSVKVGTDEPFSGGNSMKGIYGQATDATNLNIRIEANDVRRGLPIPHSAILTIQFNAGTPASGWGFSVIDLDVDQVQITAKDTSGNAVPKSTIATWFVQKFDANPSEDGVNIPSWDSKNVAVVGSSSSSAVLRTTVEGNLDDTEAASAWFQPKVSLSELTFIYESLQDSATPSYHVLIAACSTTFTSPTPTPAPSGDSDGDTIPDTTEGSGDPDNDDIPNYLDEDSDNDTVPDANESTDDTDDDGDADFVDGDSDGDGISDRIERDPDAPPSIPSDSDNNRDGIDDGDADRTDDPLSDEDNDGAPDSADEDSDNDGINDYTEAFDLDGDGDADVEPSGEDNDQNGIDDAFEEFDRPDQLNPRFYGEASDPPCEGVNLTSTRRTVRARLNELAARVPKFARKLKGCGGTFPTSLVNQAASLRRQIERTLNNSFEDRELKCPTNVCPLSNKRANKIELQALANRLYRYAKKSKLDALRVCKDPSSSKRPDSHPQTEGYLTRLQKAISSLPGSFSECD